MMIHVLVVLAAFASSAPNAAAASSRYTPKMVTTQLLPGEGRRRLERFSTQSNEIISSSQAMFVGTCQPTTPFVFPVSAGNGRGVIGCFNESANSLMIDTVDDDIETPNGMISFVGSPQPGFFAIDSITDNDMVSVPLEFFNVPDEGANATLQCAIATNIIVIYKDEVEEIGSIEAETQNRRNNNDDDLISTTHKYHERLTLLNGIHAKTNVKGDVKSSMRRGHGRNLASSTNDIHAEGTDDSLEIDYDDESEVLLAQVELQDSYNRSAYRTFVNKLKFPTLSVHRHSLFVPNHQINNNGDLEITFSCGLPSHAHFLYKIFLAVVVVDNGHGDEGPHPDADFETRAILNGGEATIIVHGGWIRMKLNELGMTNESFGWDVNLIDAQALDPEGGYQVVAELSDHDKMISLMSDTDDLAAKDKISKKPTEEEQGISLEMQEGRAPDNDNGNVDGQRRELRLWNDHTKRAKIIVHGYCTTGQTFPEAPFESDNGEYDVYTFADPNTDNPAPAAWSHDTFARKILDYIDQQGIGSCGIIAHSQGGNAALHLKTFYRSCLDYASSGSRIISSLGTPYQGTPLMNGLLSVSQVLGFSCNYVEDLSTKGAVSWLATIPDIDRSYINYYTTAYSDKPRSWDYCNVVSDLILNDPADGTIEVSRGQLPGGINRGLKEGWCHSPGMRDPDQKTDAERNAEINTETAF